MASPQKENGYTAIANEILERLVKITLLGAEYKILFFLLRKTYGYQKKEDIISLSQFQKGTGLSRPTVVKTIKNLTLRKMLVKTCLPHARISFKFNKDYDEWVVNTSKLVKGTWFASKHVLTETSKHVLTHKRKKESNTKETSSSTSVDGGMYSEEFTILWGRYPRKVGKGAAFAAWKRAKHPSLEKILDSIEQQISSEQWQRDGGQYIPHLATWINQRRWEDEVASKIISPSYKKY